MKCFVITKKQIMLGISVICALTVAVICSVSAFAGNERLLPIYCVETEKKQIAISFDAAWGNDKKVQNATKPHNTYVCGLPFFLHEAQL